jgi:hypothetical protein
MDQETNNQGYIWKEELLDGTNMAEPWDPFAQPKLVDDSLVPDLNPRAVLTRIAIRDARLPDRILKPGVWSGNNMRRDIEYHV